MNGESAGIAAGGPIVTVEDEELFDVLGSDWSECEIDAVLVCAFALATRAWITNVCGVTVVTVPTVQIPVPLL